MSEAFEFTQQPEEQPVPQPQEGPENGTAPEGENAPEEQEKKPPEDVFYCHPGGRALYGEHPARRTAAAGPVPGL